MTRPLDQLHDDPEMSFLDHLEALRWHIIRAVGVIFALTLAAFAFKDFIFDGIFLGPARLDFWTYRQMCRFFPDSLCPKDMGFTLINTDMAGQFTKHIMVSITTGIVAGFPYVLYELWRFIRPALSGKEQRYATLTILFCALLFFIGVLFGYYIVTPISVQFLGSYRVSEHIKNFIAMDSYLDTVSMLTFSSAVVFELPVAVYFLSSIGVVTPRGMRKYRRHAVVVILLLSAIITPGTDITSQLVLAIPFMFLYEVSILVSQFVLRKKNQTIAP